MKISISHARAFWGNVVGARMISALNGYVVCRHLDCAHPSVIMTCRDCGKVDEMAADEGFVALRQLCAVHGFDMDEQQLLLNGRCVQCSEQIKKS